MPGIIALFGILVIMIILLAVLALVVVKALADSPWGTFTVFATIPIAIFMGVYMRYLRARPDRRGVGHRLRPADARDRLGGRSRAEPALAPMFTFTGDALTLMLIGYGFVASVLPVWLLLAPRDYLSTFLKIGTIVGLAIGILIVTPGAEDAGADAVHRRHRPGLRRASLFPFLFITIACGAVSGFHSLIASGTTPKMIENEAHAADTSATARC